MRFGGLAYMQREYFHDAVTASKTKTQTIKRLYRWEALIYATSFFK